jgi:transcriptional regulator with XRE-family HTH domain
MARKLGVSFTTVNGWENAESEPKGLQLQVLLAIARAIEKEKPLDLIVDRAHENPGQWLRHVFNLAYAIGGRPRKKARITPAGEPVEVPLGEGNEP